MEVLRTYLSLAQTATRAEFVAAANPVYLLKRPLDRAASSPQPATTSFETRLTHLDVDPFAADWRIAPVKKRQGNPYPDRFSIGRAPSCDVVIRLPSVSKLHAHILIVGPSCYCLRDNEASNSTYVNGRKLDTRATVPLNVRDVVTLGAVEFEFVDAGRLYEILRTEL